MRVVIVGGGLSGWLTAHAFSRLTSANITSVCVLNDVASVACDAAPVQIARAPTLRLLGKAGINEADLLAYAGASFHLGYAYTGWQGDEATHFLATGVVKAPIGPVSFHHLALRMIASETPLRLSDYSLEAMCAQTQRFAPASSDPRSILSTLNHGLHIETDGFVAWVKQKAMALGTQEIETRVLTVKRNEQEDMTAIACADGLTIEGDFFIDCSGHSRLLSQRQIINPAPQIPNTRYDWTSRARSGPDLPLFVHAQASNGGWTHSLCTQHHEHQLRVSIGGDRQLSDFGRLEQIWSGNCVAIGETAATFPPSTGLELQVIVAGIDLLMTLLPSPTSTGVEAHEYNRIFSADLDQALTWNALPFALNKRERQPLWDAMRTASRSPSVETLVDTWTRLGRLNAGEGGDLFDDMDWIAMLWAFGVMPSRYDQVADGIDVQAIAAHFAKIRDVMHAAIGKLPAHSDYIRAALSS
jgi:tryptophan 7-halogenase